MPKTTSNTSLNWIEYQIVYIIYIYIDMLYTYSLWELQTILQI